MARLKIQCKRCRVSLFDSEPSVYNVHNGQVDVFSQTNTGSCHLINDSIYLEESTFPLWIKERLDQEGWLRGKLHCPKCSFRLGSFDFVTGQRCPCSQYVVPPVHLVKSKVDFIFNSTFAQEINSDTLNSDKSPLIKSPLTPSVTKVMVDPSTSLAEAPIAIPS